MWHFISIGWVEANVRAQSFTLLKANLLQDINVLMEVWKNFLKGKFYCYKAPWKKKLFMTSQRSPIKVHPDFPKLSYIFIFLQLQKPNSDGDAQIVQHFFKTISISVQF